MNSLCGEGVDVLKKDNKHNHIYDLCRSHMHAFVLAELEDGSAVDGIITGLDDEYVYIAVPIEPHQQEVTQHQDYNRQFGYGYPGYGYPGYGYGRPRRFNRLVLPLVALAAISLIPWY